MPTTIQQTAKRYKAGQLAGMALLATGVVLLFNGSGYGGALTAVGLAVYLIARALAWWHHG